MSAGQPIFHECALWSLEDIAAYSRKSKSRVRDAIVCQPDFPAAIRETPRAHPRWKAGDVWHWFEKRAATH